VKRGEIWTAAGGVYAAKPRPSLIVQDDRFDATDSMVVCPLTSGDHPAPLARLLVDADSVSGLDVPSWVMVDKISAVHLRIVTRRIGRLTAQQLAEVERLMLVVLGLAGQPSARTGPVR
jgi:mRNA interferase MazF